MVCDVDSRLLVPSSISRIEMKVAVVVAGSTGSTLPVDHIAFPVDLGTVVV